MARNLLIILPVIVFVAITWSICFLMDNKLVLFFFEKGHYVFSTGTGLRGLVIIKASVGKDTSCKITLTNTYTKLIKHHWVINDKCKSIHLSSLQRGEPTKKRDTCNLDKAKHGE